MKEANWGVPYRPLCSSKVYRFMGSDFVHSYHIHNSHFGWYNVGKHKGEPMNYVEMNESLTILKETFCKPFDGALVVLEEDSGKTLKKSPLQSALDYSWDGELYWFPQEAGQTFLAFAKDWFKENAPRMNNDYAQDFSNLGIVNCLLYSQTKTGIVFIDPMRDMGSTIDELIHAFEEKNPHFANERLYISECHLADNLQFGRDSVVDQDAILKHLYDEGLVSDAAFIYSLDELLESLDEEHGKTIDRTVVLTGEFSLARKEITEILEEAGVNVAARITSEKDWLWVGEKPGKDKVAQAQKHNAQISTISEIMQWYLEQSGQKSTKKLKF